MKYRPGESVRRETDPVQRRNENSRNVKKQLVRRRRKVLLILFLVLLIFGAAFGYFLYQNSYVGKVAKGYDALQMKEYQTAEKYFKHAIGKNAQRAEAYSGLAETYMEQDEGMRQNPYFFLLLLLIHPTKNCIGQQSAFMRRQSSLIRFPRFSRTAMTNPCFPV